MLRFNLSTFLFLSLAFALHTQQASAHANLTTVAGVIEPRDLFDGHKGSGPCGPGSKAALPTVVTANTDITVEWLETVEHSGFWYVNLISQELGLNKEVVNIVDAPSDKGKKSATITIPDIDCADCILQLIQTMGNTSESGYYFSCADVIISKSGEALPLPKAKLREMLGNNTVFEKLDSDSDNALSQMEITAANGAADQVAALITELDQNSDAALTLSELAGTASGGGTGSVSNSGGNTNNSGTGSIDAGDSNSGGGSVDAILLVMLSIIVLFQFKYSSRKQAK